MRIYDNELSAAAVAGLYTNNAITAVSANELLGLAIDGGSANPSRGNRLRGAFSLPTAEPAGLALFDLGGRRIARSTVGSLGEGRHEVDLAAGRTIPPGIYLIQLTQAGQSRTRRITVLQ